MFLLKKKKNKTKLTDLGKVLANIRIENSETMMEQAKKLKISITLLSAYSYGDRKIKGYVVKNLFANYKSLNEYSCKVIVSEIFVDGFCDRLMKDNPEKQSWEIIEFVIHAATGIEYKIKH